MLSGVRSRSFSAEFPFVSVNDCRKSRRRLKRSVESEEASVPDCGFFAEEFSGIETLLPEEAVTWDSPLRYFR